MRSGCFCNPGACETYLHITPDRVRAHLALGKVCGDERDLINGQFTGALRASFGYMSTMDDSDALVGVLQKYFVQSAPAPEPPSAAGAAATGVLKEIWLYPVKSCSGMQVTKQQMPVHQLL